MNKVTTMGAAALATCATVAGGSMLVAPAAQARVPAVAAGLPQTGDQLAYVQRGDVVTVYRSGETLAKVKVRSAAHPGGRAQLVLKVNAHKTFAFRVNQFLWADAQGDHDAYGAGRKIRVTGGATQTVTIRFFGVRDGNVIWAPRRENSVGVWQVKGPKAVGAPQLLGPSYVQRDATVSVFKAGQVVARVTAQSAVRAQGKGRVRLEVEALAKVALRPASFVWVDKDGDRHRPVGGTKVTFRPKTTQSLWVNYTDVGAGGLTWAPQVHQVAGAWGIG